MKFTHSIDIQATPQIVWAIWSDIERWSEWTASITKIQKLAPGPLAVGLRACVRQPKLPVAIWRVTELEENRGFTWVSTSLGAHVTGIHAIERHADGTRATLTLTFAGPIAVLFGWLSRSLTQRYLQLEANGLKVRSEQIAISQSDSAEPTVPIRRNDEQTPEAAIQSNFTVCSLRSNRRKPCSRPDQFQPTR